MVQQGETIVMSTSEMQILGKEIALNVIKEVASTMIWDKPSSRLLSIEGVMEKFGVSRTTVDSWRRRKKNKLEMFGSPPRIEEDVAVKWFKDHSGEYQTE